MASKLNWTIEVNLFVTKEEKMLKELKRQDDSNDWSNIADKLNALFLGKNKTGKQCRERFINHVQYEAEANSKSIWHPSEIPELFSQFLTHGAKWTLIAKNISGSEKWEYFYLDQKTVPRTCSTALFVSFYACSTELPEKRLKNTVSPLNMNHWREFWTLNWYRCSKSMKLNSADVR